MHFPDFLLPYGKKVQKATYWLFKCTSGFCLFIFIFCFLLIRKWKNINHNRRSPPRSQQASWSLPPCLKRCFTNMKPQNYQNLRKVELTNVLCDHRPWLHPMPVFFYRLMATLSSLKLIIPNSSWGELKQGNVGSNNPSSHVKLSKCPAIYWLYLFLYYSVEYQMFYFYVCNSLLDKIVFCVFQVAPSPRVWLLYNILPIFLLFLHHNFPLF